MGLRVIAVEDDRAVAELITSVLASSGFTVCGTAATGEDGLTLARRERPDVALIDLGLPKMSGEDVIAAIRQELPKTACIALTAVDIPARVLGAMRAGAAGYILKPFHASELARSIEEVVSGDAAPISPRAAKGLLQELRGDPPDQRAKEGPALSKRELEVLQLLVHGHTYEDVAQALGIAQPSVKTYVKRIYEKMDRDDKVNGRKADIGTPQEWRPDEWLPDSRMRQHGPRVRDRLIFVCKGGMVAAVAALVLLAICGKTVTL